MPIPHPIPSHPFPIQSSHFPQSQRCPYNQRSVLISVPMWQEEDVQSSSVNVHRLLHNRKPPSSVRVDFNSAAHWLCTMSSAQFRGKFNTSEKSVLYVALPLIIFGSVPPRVVWALCTYCNGANSERATLPTSTTTHLLKNISKAASRPGKAWIRRSRGEGAAGTEKAKLLFW